MVADASWMPCDNFSEDWPRSTVVQKKVLHKSGSKLDKYTCRENAKGERKNGIEGRANDSKSNEGVLNFQNMSQPAIFFKSLAIVSLLGLRLSTTNLCSVLPLFCSSPPPVSSLPLSAPSVFSVLSSGDSWVAACFIGLDTNSIDLLRDSLSVSDASFMPSLSVSDASLIPLDTVSEDCKQMGQKHVNT